MLRNFKVNTNLVGIFHGAGNELLILNRACRSCMSMATTMLGSTKRCRGEGTQWENPDVPNFKDHPNCSFFGLNISQKPWFFAIESLLICTITISNMGMGQVIRYPRSSILTHIHMAKIWIDTTTSPMIPSYPGKTSSHFFYGYSAIFPDNSS